MRKGSEKVYDKWNISVVLSNWKRHKENERSWVVL
jgi:hypothetical protein